MNIATAITRFSMASIAGSIISVGLNPAVVYAFVTPVSSSLRLEANSNAGSGLVTDTYTDSQFKTINSLGAAVAALATSGNASVLSQAQVTSIWKNSYEGVVTFTDVGWKTINVNSGLANLYGGLDWSYEFIADTTGFLTMDYDVKESGTSTFGLNAFLFNWSKPGGDAAFLPNTSGTIERTIYAGQTYTVGLKNFANISGGLGTREAMMSGTFKWKIVSVPEPTTILTSLIIAGGFGVVRHRKNKHSQKAIIKDS